MYDHDDLFRPASGPVPGFEDHLMMNTGPLHDPFATTQLSAVPGQWDLDAEFEQLLQQPLAAGGAPPVTGLRTAGRPAVHRRRRPRRIRRLASAAKLAKLAKLPWLSLLSILIATVTAAIAAVISMLGAMISYDPLRQLANPTAHDLASSWPLLVYGPWLAGCLSILRAAAHRRQVKAAWAVVTAFSSIAVALCVAHTQRTITSMATAGLPPVAALACFHLLYRQITLVHPRHAKLPRQRKH